MQRQVTLAMAFTLFLQPDARKPVGRAMSEAWAVLPHITRCLQSFDDKAGRILATAARMSS